MASTKTTTYAVDGRKDSDDFRTGDSEKQGHTKGRAGVYQGAAADLIQVGGMRQGSLRGQAYVYGNVARQPDVLPMYEAEYRQKTSRQVLRNRRREMNMNAAYAVFLASAAIAAVVICFLYLRLQSETVNRSENITALQRELAELTEANDAAYQAAADSVNLNTVRDRAVNELGMVYASQGRVVPYENPTTDCVKQYEDIPDNGFLAKSGNQTE